MEIVFHWKYAKQTYIIRKQNILLLTFMEIVFHWKYAKTTLYH